MGAFAVIVFDYDGTLCDTRPAIVHCIERAFTASGRPAVSSAAIINAVENGLTLQETFVLLDARLRADRSALNDLVVSYRRLYGDESAPLLKLYDGVPDTLRQLHAGGSKCVVVSNKGVAAIRQSLDDNKLGAFIEAVFGDQPGLPHKPDPALLSDYVLPRYADVEKSQLLMVGDTEVDIVFAKKAGIASCWASYGYGEAERCRALAPNYRIASIRALPEVVGGG